MNDDDWPHHSAGWVRRRRGLQPWVRGVGWRRG